MLAPGETTLETARDYCRTTQKKKFRCHHAILDLTTMSTGNTLSRGLRYPITTTLSLNSGTDPPTMSLLSKGRFGKKAFPLTDPCPTLTLTCLRHTNRYQMASNRSTQPLKNKSHFGISQFWWTSMIRRRMLWSISMDMGQKGRDKCLI